jgi:hypothetical protein
MTPHKIESPRPLTARDLCIHGVGYLLRCFGKIRSLHFQGNWNWSNWKHQKYFVFSGFRCSVDEVFAVLGGHAALIGSWSPTLGTAYRLPFFLVCLTLESGAEKLSRNFGNYQSTLRNIPAKSKFHMICQRMQRQPEVQGAERGFVSSEWRNLVTWLLPYLLCGDTSHFDFGVWPDPRRWSIGEE